MRRYSGSIRESDLGDFVSLADYQKIDKALSQILDALEDRYDGAPDAHMGWMAELIQIGKRARG